ncbi:hypothetical protein P389DRAFT_87369 [Cystobasidium minutum MCA 4210]|uniref:uncharacterized protein n=1 Tax=Cystobasidium minutum MCA 4210 TaxID=1397322 RepID=UPI0034CFD7EE|eukprot:jgi/Rhomi1/87369/CE87368_1374
MPFGPSHRILRKAGEFTMNGFFKEIKVEGSENVPQDGPLLVCCTHWNMIVDPAILSCWFPHKRMLHYWAKSTIFINKPVSALLKDAGNIPVDRKNKDNQKLFSGTFEALKLNEAVAIFPEGTSYTEPRLQEIKDGASWAVLEYAKNLRNDLEAMKAGSKDATVVVASIVYTKKTNYRTRAIMRFTEPIDTKPYIEKFLDGSDPEGPKKAVKALTLEIRNRMVEMTINAPDWETLKAAETARELLWGDDDNVPLEHWTAISQSLVDLFSPTSEYADSAASARQALIAYEASLKARHFTNSSLNALPLPRILDPQTAATPPDRLRTLWALTQTTISSLLYLPFFILPLLTHLPIYTIGKITQIYLNNGEPEAFAQNKIVFSLLVLVVFIYPTMFFFTWALFLFTPIGFLLAVAWTVLFSVYHTRLIDRNYARWKKLVATWRVLAGIWAPQFMSAASSGENKIRQMLRLRSESAQALADLLIKVEYSSAQNGSAVQKSGNDGQENGAAAKFSPDMVDWYRSLGARLGTSHKAGHGMVQHEGDGEIHMQRMKQS